MNSIKYLPILLLFLFFVSCKKENQDPLLEKGKVYTNGILVLNEGLFQQNNSSLSWLDFETNEVTKNIFLAINERPLGDTGNDMMSYGGKIYIVVTGSSTIEVIDKKTLVSLKQIQFNYNNKAQQPRQITSSEGKVYVSSFDGYVSAIDTTSLKVTKRVKVGRNPEGIYVTDQSLFVANSGGLNANHPDSTVFEINLNTFQIVDTFIVGKNPGDIIGDDHNNLYIVKRGNYSNDLTELIRINTVDRSVVNLGISTTTFAKRGDILYLSDYDFNSGISKVALFNCSSQSIINSNFINNQAITTLYGVVPYQSDQLICIDAMQFTNSGYLRFFSGTGQLIKSYNVGLNPSSIIIK